MNANLLKGKIRALGMTQEDVAKKIGLSVSRFNAKINGAGGAEFVLKEVRALKDLLSLDAQEVDAIFFAQKLS